MADVPPEAIEAALREEREFVLTLGGFALEIPGATLVTHERVPVPKFNFVQDLWIGADRQTAFFERALDHYFQRALRPTFRVPFPTPPHVDGGLRRFGFRPLPDPWTLLVQRAGSRGALSPGPIRVERASIDRIDEVTPFWIGDREGAEFRRALQVVWAHPNPGERMSPLLAYERERPVAAALVYTFGPSMGIHAVATQPADRGRGAASALVEHALAHETSPEVRFVSIESDSPRLEKRLLALGFAPARRWTVYELPAGASLSLPDPGPPTPPRWRPPRGAKTAPSK